MSFTVALNLQPDAIVLGVTFLFCLFATILFSLGPALKATRADLVNDLKQQVGEPAHAGRLNRFFAPRHLLVMMQIALSLMLLFSAGLFLRSAMKAGGVDLGFSSRDGLDRGDGFLVEQHRGSRRQAPHVRDGATRA